MKVNAYKINAFAKSAQGGNPAGVVVHADSLSEYQMKKIAAILGLSETAFVMQSNCADFKVRFFTPTEEVDLCGHATIGTFSTLLSQGYIQPGSFTQETLAGVLKVEVQQDATIMMHQTPPTFYEIIDQAEIADSLHISPAKIHAKLPIQIVSTGLRDILIPIPNIAALNSIRPDFNKVAEVSRKYNTIGYHLFTLNALAEANAHCRNLAPRYGIPEESATGTSNGALACYLYQYNQISAQDAEKIVFEQGYGMNKPSEILVSLRIEEKGILDVKVGGKSLNLSAVELEI